MISEQQEFLSIFSREVKQVPELQSLLHCMPPRKLMIFPPSGLLDTAISLIEKDHFRFVSAGQIKSLPNPSLSQDMLYWFLQAL
jgi:hypothetical protein